MKINCCCDYCTILYSNNSVNENGFITNALIFTSSLRSFTLVDQGGANF